MNDLKGYHPYVFDVPSRRFIGRFDEMYRAELHQGFDSWHQDDMRNLTKRVCVEVLASYNFARVLDVGCGKGAFTQQLVRQNNHVTGIDISETALTIARSRCPDVTFIQADVASPDVELRALIGTGFDLVVCLETLSYFERWAHVIEQMATVGRYALIALDIPENPIGFVKSPADLVHVFARSFTLIEDIRMQTRRQTILFGESRVDSQST